VTALTILSYFAHNLRVSGYPVSWTFFAALSVSSLTILSTLTTAVLHHFGSLRPRLSLWANAALSALWAAAVGMLTWYLWGTLVNECSTETWMHENGVFVCRTYKGLEFAEWVGLIATVGSLMLDVSTVRNVKRRGYGNIGGGVALAVKRNLGEDGSYRPHRDGASDTEPLRAANEPYAVGGMGLTDEDMGGHAVQRRARQVGGHGDYGVVRTMSAKNFEYTQVEEHGEQDITYAGRHVYQ